MQFFDFKNFLKEIGLEENPDNMSEYEILNTFDNVLESSVLAAKCTCGKPTDYC